MRASIFKYLMANCQSIKSWHQPYTTTADTTKPYGVIVLGEDMSSVNRLGFFDSLYIWPYFDPGSFVAVDSAVQEIKKLLSGAVLSTDSGAKFEIEYIRKGRDFKDDELKALTKNIEFRIPLVG